MRAQPLHKDLFRLYGSSSVSAVEIGHPMTVFRVDQTVRQTSDSCPMDEGAPAAIAPLKNYPLPFGEALT